MDDEQKELMKDYGLDEDQAETAEELIDAGLSEDEAAEIAEKL